MKRLFLAIAVGIFVLSTAIVWFVQTRVVFSRVAEYAEEGRETILVNLEYQTEPELCRFAQELTVEWGDAETAARADVAAAARRLHVDRVTVVGTNGVVVASSVPGAVGYDFASRPETAGFLALNGGGEHFVAQEFRKPVDAPDAPPMKFVGIAFPGGGFVQIGDSIHPGDTRRRDYVFVQSMQDEHISDNGFFVLVSESDGRIVSTQDRAKAGGLAADAGLAGLDFGAGDGPVRARVFGSDSLVWRVKPAFFNVVGYVVFPLSELMHSRNVSVGLAALLLFIVLTTGYVFFLKINSQSVRLREQNLKMEAFYAKEEADRQRDLALAKTIQASALPSVFPPFPDRREFDLYAMMRTAKEVGGDFYDFYFVSPNRLCLVVADVSGKGIPAALFMMKSRAVIKTSVVANATLAEAVAQANDRLCLNNTAEMFVTAWVGVFDIDSGELEYVSAGHNPPFVRRADGAVEMLKVRPALVLAAMEGVRYRSQKTVLSPGDSLFLYTDGVTEATAADGGLFGDPRLEGSVRDAAGDARAYCEKVVADVDAFVAEAPQADDITVLAFAYKGIVGTTTRTFPASIEGLSDATQFLQRRLDAAKCSDKTVSAMMVAMDEIASNIVRYSGAPDFTVRVSVEDARVRVVFSDAGKEFNPLGKADPDVTLSAEDRAIGGLGLFMVKRMMDAMDYARVDGRNVLTVEKNRT